jgi:signal transduction histidine kinase/DNA-binding response OmpR family regulator
MPVFKYIKPLVFLFFLHYVVFIAHAQHESPKPLDFVLKANYDGYSTNDVFCFENQFTDSYGRLWFSTCLLSKFTATGLVSFDGKTYTSPRTASLDLKHYSKYYIGILNDRVFGQAIVGEEGYLFYYDIEANSIKVYDSIPLEKKTVKNPSTIIFSEQRSNVYQNIFEDKIYTYIRENGNVRLTIYDENLQKQSYKSIALPKDEFIVFNGGQNVSKEWYFGFNHGTAEIVKLNLTSGSRETIATNLNPKEYQKDFHVLDIFPSHISLRIKNSKTNVLRYVFKTFENALNDTDKLNYHQVMESSDNFIFFTNTKGQNIFQFYNFEKKKNVLYINDTDGKVYDASGILKDFNNFSIKKIYSEDFTKRLHILTERGLNIYDIAPSNALVKQIYTKGPVRGIEQFDDYLVYLKETGLNEEKLYHLATQQHEKKTLCGFNRLKLQKTGQHLWGVIGSDLAYYDIEEEQCNTVDLKQNVYLFSITPDHQNIVFSDFENRFWVYDIKTGETSPLLYNNEILKLGNEYKDFIVDGKSILWVATLSGLYKYDISDKKLVHINGLSEGFNFSLISLMQNKDHELWLGSYNSGLIIFNTQNYSFRIISEKKGLSNNTVASITKDLNGLIWVATYNGVSVLDSTAKVLDNLNEEDGLVNKEANRYAATLLENGQVAIGTIDGISIIDPNIFLSTYHKKDDFRIFFTQINFTGRNKDSITTITSGFNTLNTITLPQSNRNINLEFASSNYIAPDKISYAYKIDKYLDEWTLLGESNQLSLYNLSAGDYELSIKAINERGKQSENMLRLNLKVEEFFYYSIEFYIGLLCLICIASLSFIFFLKNRIRNATARIVSDNMRLEHLTEKLKDLNRTKNDFFTHITHEFRTPLTVIKGVTQHLKRSSNHNYDKEIETLEHHSEDLLDMVNQILDLRKISSNKLQLHLEQSDLVLHVKYIVDNLQFPALQKGIALKVTAHSEAIMMDLDTDKLKSVINNIISNAIKHTPEGGEISVQVSQIQQHSTAKIDIIDNGEGISNKELQKVFELFYQTENELFTKTKGSGIGLYYAKTLIDMMKGEIAIKNNEKQGTTVSITLPITNNAERSVKEIPSILTEAKTRKTIDSSNKKDAYNILIIEDNPSVRALLDMQLSSAYNLSFAHDGDQGIKTAFKIIPDIIISDIMMPGKDGYEVCSILKQDQRTSHIPIILLTARVDQPSKLKGLEVEADAYVKKPYDINELHLQIHNLINNRRRLQNIYQHFDKNTAPTQHPKEDEFILKFREVILNNIENENFKIDDVCEKLKISRSGLHGKIKALTGLSAANYINKIRTQRAKVLIETEDKNISEIAYMVGITNLPYFSTLYKKEFGESPKAYKDHLDK